MHCLDRVGAKSGFVLKRWSPVSIFGQELLEIQDVVNFPRGSFPFRYLGIPLAAAKLKVNQYASLIDKISVYINAWSGSALSYAGRAELIRAVLEGVECFWLSILPIPAVVIERITSFAGPSSGMPSTA